MTKTTDRTLEKVTAVSSCMADPKSYAGHMTRDRWLPTPSAKRVAQYALQQLEAARKKDIEAHDRNLPKIEANQKAREKILVAINEAGIPDHYFEVPSNSRSRYPKKKRHEAGYLGDLRRNLPANDEFAHSTLAYERLKEKYEAYAKQAEDEDRRKAEAEEREKAVAAEQRKADLMLAQIILRYELPEDSDWDAALGALREMDQRLDLAVAMYMTRGDWSEGYYRVSQALNRFTVVSPEDAEIQTDILSCFNDDIDGRVFRDTTWSYDRLFSSATNQQLATDIQLALSKVDYL